MAETVSGSVIARTKSDVSAMKETLRVQQQLLQKLYAELDEEREASATATSEALDMILRLQGEKAAVVMEACHYKRVAEEKMCHSEETIVALEEVVCQKEMEIASLEFQVQAYKQKLLSLGCDFSVSEFEFPEDLILNGNDQLNGEKGQSSNVRRMHSMPPIQFKSSLKLALKSERSPSPVSDVIPEVILESTDQEVTAPNLDLRRKLGDFAFGSGNLDSYWNQIKRLDEQVKVISDCTEGEENSSDLSSRRGRSSSFLSLANRIISDQQDRFHSANSDRKEDANPPCLPNVHDVFEVPQASEKHENEISERLKKRLEKWKSEAENRLTKPDPVSEGMVESSLKHDADKQKGVVRVHREIKAPSIIDMVTINGLKKEITGVECNAQSEFQKLHQRIERLERERISPRHEIIHEGNGEEQLSLLKDVQNQLKLIQSEMRSWKTKEARSWKAKEATPKDDDVSLSLLQLQEVQCNLVFVSYSFDNKKRWKLLFHTHCFDINMFTNVNVCVMGKEEIW